MEKKEKSTKLTRAEKKVSTGLIFLASVFFTTIVLLYSGDIIFVTIAGVLMMGAAYLFLNAIFEDKVEEWNKLSEEAFQEDFIDIEGLLEPEEVKEEKLSEEDMYNGVMTRMESIDRTNKAMFSVMKRSEENTEAQIRRLEKAIEKVATQQAADHKELVKYNKENARQMAINERETLEHVLHELKEVIKEKPSVVIPQEVQEEHVYTAPTYNEESVFEEPVTEEELSLDDILQMAMPQTEEPVPKMDEEPEEPTVSVEPTLDVDLSDPNATLTPEDIAKLFAAAGN